MPVVILLHLLFSILSIFIIQCKTYAKKGERETVRRNREIGVSASINEDRKGKVLSSDGKFLFHYILQ